MNPDNLPNNDHDVEQEEPIPYVCDMCNAPIRRVQHTIGGFDLCCSCFSTSAANLEKRAEIATAELKKELLKKLPSPGLYGKYKIAKSDGTPTALDADYFVLRLDTDEIAREAVLVYAQNVEAKNSELADDLRRRCGLYGTTQ